jgi:hypothetical protein
MPEGQVVFGDASGAVEVIINGAGTNGIGLAGFDGIVGGGIAGAISTFVGGLLRDINNSSYQ